MTQRPRLVTGHQQEEESEVYGVDRDSPTNEAADLAHQFQVCQRAGIKTWGFVVYRCTYTSDSDWQHFLDVLNWRTMRDLRFYNHPELYDSLCWIVHSDPQTLDGASKDSVRAHFREWVERELAQVDPKYDLTMRWHPKFMYCMHVDEASLKSVVDDAPQPPKDDLEGVGYINLVRKDWDEQWAKESDGENEEEIDGRRTYDVGFMKAAIDGLAPRTYTLLGMRSDFYGDEYVRPPAIAKP